MANIKSAIKRIRTTKRNEVRNKGLKLKIKKAVKEAKSAISAKSADMQKTLRAAIKRLDKSVTKGVMHKKTAARKKSRLMKMFNKAK